MSARLVPASVVMSQDAEGFAAARNEGGGATYELEASGAKITIHFYRGDPELNELAWRAEVTFLSSDTIIAGEGVNPRAAFLAAVSRQEVIVRQGIPLPAIGWYEVERVLEGKGAFRGPSLLSDGD